MSREKQLVKNTLIYGIGNFASKFLGFILLPFYTYYLSTGDYGYYDLLTIILSLLIPIITFQINDGLYRFLINEKDINVQKKVISSSLTFTIISMTCWNLLFVVFLHFVKFYLAYLLIVQLDIMIINSVNLQISRGLKKNLVYSISGVLVTLITLICNIILIVIFNYKIEALLISNIIAYIISIIYIEYKIKVTSYFKITLFDKGIILKVLCYSIPLIPNVLNWWIVSLSDRFIIKYFLGISANGIYAVSNKFPSVLALINSIFYLAWQDISISEYQSKDKNEFYTKMFNAFMIIEFTSVIFLISINKPIVKMLVDMKFYNSWRYIPLLYIGAVFNAFSSFYGMGYQTSKETKGAFYTSVFGALINIILNVILISKIGIQAASFSTMVAFLLMWLVRVKQTKKYFIIDFNKFNFIIFISILIIITLLSFVENIYIELILIIISSIILISYNRKIAFKLLNVIQKKLIASK